MKTETYKEAHRQEKLLNFKEDQRGKRDAALLKSRGRKSFFCINYN